MIRRILVVAQGPNDVGFLKGLRDLLECDAELTTCLADGKEARLRDHVTRSRQDAQYIWDQRGEVDLIVRLTDGDTAKPQDTLRAELARWPEQAREMLICGVCDRDVEHWMCLDVDYAARALNFDKGRLPERREERSGFIKNRIREQCPSGEYDTFVARFVAGAPRETIRRWLQNPAFRQFHDHCVRAARRHDCRVKELR